MLDTFLGHNGLGFLSKQLKRYSDPIVHDKSAEKSQNYAMHAHDINSIYFEVDRKERQKSHKVLYWGRRYLFGLKIVDDSTL